MWLADETFRTVVASTPLVAIDLLVRLPDGSLLLGKRANPPAQGYWFVPGGRVQKNEPLDSAFRRLTETELGVPLPRSDARLLGVYQHFYADSIFGQSPDTHYVVMAYVVDIDSQESLQLPVTQHDAFLWKLPENLLGHSGVHPYTRDYLPALAHLPSKGL
ncbi:MAG: GDP-mannose mannosyl hydrolase [Sphingopyxis sp.]|nr:MAG: GDP-mannose mannosyl hydrolase [Sphingopyxis sp.]